ncbi:MAG: hypothetical protein QOD93_675, partial [Acetobacteraceae bacterium]|nr:hypothetical protein [Acetobacteraceae bacterium]MEA2767713.1 hypothetical protein [Acetobacteraceae bacterium]
FGVARADMQRFGEALREQPELVRLLRERGAEFGLDARKDLARLGIDASGFDHTAYSARTRQRHRLQILELSGFRPFDGDAARLLETELATMARSHFGHALMFWRAVDWLVSRRIEIPTSFRLTEAVSRAVQQRERAIAKLIAQAMTSEVRLLLDNILLRDEDAASQSPFRLTLLKRLSQSTRPTKIRERLSDLGVL